MTDENQRAVENFRTYLRIPSVQPNVDYSGCVEFLTKQAQEIGLELTTLQFTDKKPILILTLKGNDTALPTINLISHMDVVPAYPELWHHDPFGAEMDEEGNIYARGSQDTKCTGIQYLEAIRRLLQAGQTFKRTIHLLFVPDEEDGVDGVEQLAASDELKKLNMGFVLDEGESNIGDEFTVFYAEKAIWHAVFKASGTSGHGSANLPDTAGEKLRVIIDRVMDYRKGQAAILAGDSSLDESDVTFVNFTEVQGGVAPNVVPAELSATFDFRLAVDEDHDKFEAMFAKWCEEAGSDVTVEYIAKEPASPPTPIDTTNYYWTAMKNTLDDLGEKIKTAKLAGGTDSRFLRRVGIWCLGFSPMNRTPALAHANDEFLNKDVFLRGIEVYQAIVPAIANA